MKLFTKAIDEKLFKQFSKASDLSVQDVVVKIFNPYGAGTWYIVNSDPSDPDYLWAIVQMGYGAEIGSVSRSFLENYKNKFGWGFERDTLFDQINAEELFQGLLQGEFYKDGGAISDENREMLINQNEQIDHHSDELEDILKKPVRVPAWVIAKMGRATADLSDITHYLDGKEEMIEEMSERQEELIDGITEVEETDSKEKDTPFMEMAFNKIKKFLKGMNNIDLEDDMSFQYDDLEYYISPMVKSGDSGVESAFFNVYDDNDNMVGEIDYSSIRQKQYFRANSELFGWTNTKFEHGGDLKNNNKFNYMLLSRLKMDCDYYLGYGNRNNKVLWAGNVDDQINKMKELWNGFPKDAKPEWLSMEEILEYENKMKEQYSNGGNIDVYYIDEKVLNHWDYSNDNPNRKIFIESQAEIDGDVYEVVAINPKEKLVKVKNFSKGGKDSVRILPFNIWKYESTRLYQPVSFYEDGMTVSGEVVLRNGQKAVSLYRDNNYSGNAERIRYFKDINLDTLVPFIIGSGYQYEQGGFMSNVYELGGKVDGSFNKMARQLAIQNGFTIDKLGVKEYNKTMYKALREALTDINYHEEARELVSHLTGYTDNQEIWNSEYYESDEKIDEFAREITKKSRWDYEKVIDAFYYITKVEGSKVGDTIMKLFSEEQNKSKLNYITKSDIKYVIVKDKKSKELKYNGSDVFNGVNVSFEKGGDLSKKANYFSKQNIVRVELKDGRTIKPLNGYWIKKDAKPVSNFEMKYTFEIGDVVWDKNNQTYGVVLNNFENNKEGDSGELRLDSDGMQYIFETDKNYEKIGYNLAPFGSEDDLGDGDLTDTKQGAKRIIKFNPEYYNPIYKRLLDGEFDNIKKQSKTNSNSKNINIDETFVKKDFRNNWKAESIVYNQNGYDWRISTHKTSKGDLVTSVQAGQKTKDENASTFKYTVHKDPYYAVIVTKPSRITEKVVTEQHNKALEAFKGFLESGKFEKGGKLSNFEKLSRSVAKNYVGKPVKSEYQDEYGKYYSESEAKEVGNKVAGKIKAQQSKKMLFGGLSKKSNKINFDDKQGATKDGRAVHVLSHDGDTVLVMDMDKLGTGASPYRLNVSELDEQSFFKKGGMVKNSPRRKKQTVSKQSSSRLKNATELAKKIRKPNEKWSDALKRAFTELK